MKVVIWGTYDTGKPRTRILIAGLIKNGIQVEEIHKDIWSDVADKSQLSLLAKIWFLSVWIFAYPRLIIRYLRSAKHDIVLVPYMGHLDVFFLRIFAKFRRVPIVWDMFISLYDTTVNDRKTLAKNGMRARLLHWLERTACNFVARTLLDTAPHAQNIGTILGVGSDRIDWVPVGVELNAFPRLAPNPVKSTKTKLLFYGQMIPLHGISTILEAAQSNRGLQFDWHLIGRGQDDTQIEVFLTDHSAENVTWEEWVPYEHLIERIQTSDICLGIFGASNKAASVVPNKVYQVVAAGRPLITRQSEAMDQFLQGYTQGIKLIPPRDSEALLDAAEELLSEGLMQPDSQLISRIGSMQIGKSLINILDQVLKASK